MAHEHGPHTCYCPNCSFEKEVDAYTKCNSQTCPVCNTRMRAKDTGEYRIANGVEPPAPTCINPWFMLALGAAMGGLTTAAIVEAKKST